MDKVTRCKFKCESVKSYEQGQKDYEFSPVMGGSEENKEFWKQSPSGHFRLGCVNPNVSFEPGKEYYIDIKLAE